MLPFVPAPRTPTKICSLFCTLKFFEPPSLPFLFRKIGLSRIMCCHFPQSFRIQRTSQTLAPLPIRVYIRSNLEKYRFQKPMHGRDWIHPSFGPVRYKSSRIMDAVKNFSPHSQTPIAFLIFGSLFLEPITKFFQTQFFLKSSLLIYAFGARLPPELESPIS